MNRRRRSMEDREPFAERAPVRASVSGRGAKSSVSAPPDGPEDDSRDESGAGGSGGGGGDEGGDVDAPGVSLRGASPGSRGGGGGWERVERKRGDKMAFRITDCLSAPLASSMCAIPYVQPAKAPKICMSAKCNRVRNQPP